ncbi:MAG: YihY/virulence factor BrkB family protein, partial [Longimicrobiales bacterium]
MTSSLRSTWELFREAWKGFQEDDATQWGAALAYYTILSFAPLVLILLTVSRFVYGDAAARTVILEWAARLFGPQGPDLTRTILERAPESGAAIGIGSGLVLVFVATRVFAHLQQAMNHVWNVEWKAGGLKGMVRSRLRGFLMVLVLTGLLVTAMAASAIAAFFAPYADRMLPGSDVYLTAANFVVTFGVLILLFASLFRILPDVVIAWRDVWVGAAVSASLFLVGNALLGLYLSRADVGSAWGAAGSFLGILVWVYWSAQVYFFGAEFTEVWA